MLRLSRMLLLAGVCCTICAFTSPAHAQGAGTTDGRDIIVGDLYDVASWGVSGTIAAFSVGTISCNIGDVAVPWVASTNEHPVIGQNMFRLKDGVMEQIGQSWLKHGFTALTGTTCSAGLGGCTGPGGSQLSPGCSDPYSAGLNGSQSNLGPRSPVNAATGYFPYPFSAPSPEPVIGRRLQVIVDDLLPALNPGAEYFVTGRYVSSADSEDENDNNNVSYRRINVAGTSPYTISLIDSTQRQLTAIDAWQDSHADVEIDVIDISGDGRIVLGTRVIDLGGNQYQYEYAIYNMTSDASVGSFTVQTPPGTSFLSTGFHAVFSHSGEPYSNTPWTITPGSTSIVWSTQTFSSNPNANALRWDNMYNFRFVTDQPPVVGNATIGLFKSPGQFTVQTLVPDNGTISNFSCAVNAQGVQLDWLNGTAFTTIELRRNGSSIATLAGTAQSYLDTSATAGFNQYEVIGFVGAVAAPAAVCALDVPQPLVVAFTGAIPKLISDQGETLAVTITQFNGGVYASGSAQLHVDSGAGFVSTPLIESPPLAFTVNLPALACGTSIAFYVSANSTLGETFTAPDGAPTVVHEAVVASAIVTEFADTMETDTGWIVGTPSDTATTSGIWVREDPNGSAAQPEDDSSDDGAFAWFTGQGAPGAALGAADVDGGSTTLTSPAINLAGSDSAVISYRRWFSNDTGAAPGLDIFEVEVSADGTNWVNVETVGPTGAEASGDWYSHEFRVADFVTPSAAVRVRFRASDTGAASIVEAAIDFFEVRDFVCGPLGESFMRGDCNGSGLLDISDASFLLSQLFVPGSPSGPCQDACDVNDDSLVNIADAVYTLIYLFQFGANPLPPFPDCAIDPTFDGVSCDSVPPNCP
ncbi:MAG: dockerin type I repeat-containing protein [Planctomycetota bacterium]